MWSEHDRRRVGVDPQIRIFPRWFSQKSRFLLSGARFRAPGAPRSAVFFSPLWPASSASPGPRFCLRTLRSSNFPSFGNFGDLKIGRFHPKSSCPGENHKISRVASFENVEKTANLSPKRGENTLHCSPRSAVFDPKSKFFRVFGISSS